MDIGDKVKIVKNSRILRSAGLESLEENPDLFKETFEITDVDFGWFILDEKFKVLGNFGTDLTFPEELLIEQ